MTIPAYLPYFVFAGTAATIIAILYGLHRSLVEADWPEADRARTFRASDDARFFRIAWRASHARRGEAAPVEAPPPPPEAPEPTITTSYSGAAIDIPFLRGWKQEPSSRAEACR